MVTMAEKRDPSAAFEKQGRALKADIVYLLMRKKYHISCNLRVQWYLDHLNSYITVPARKKDQEDEGEKEEGKEEEDSDLEVVSVLPLEPPADWRPEVSSKYRYLITAQSSVVFLTHQYRVAFCLDMSPSVCAVDIQHGEVMSDEILTALRRSVEGMVQPFVVPGSCVVFQPDIYVTVMAHTPFFATPAQQVLVQGWHITPENVGAFLSCVESQLVMLEDVVAEVTSIAHEQLEALRAESERLVGDLFEEEQSESQAPSATAASIPMVSPDAGFINMLRYGLLALRLLPDCSSSNLVVLTDGIIATPDVKVLDSVVTQLRVNAVACSFVQLGSRFHPNCSAGLVPYSDLLQYLSSATQGSYVTEPREVVAEPLSMNFYHNAFLTWSFRRTNYEFCAPVPQAGEWHVSNHLFYGRREPQLLLKKQAEDKLNISLYSLLCCRLHQGYTVKNVCMKDGQVEINLIQAWNSHIYLDYKITAPWPGGFPVHYSLSIQAPYEFLHDITCLLKKPLGSPYRQLVVSRFWHTLKTLGQSDQLLVHLHSLSTAAATPPDAVRSGMPLFYLPAVATPATLPVPVLASNDNSCQQFAQFWRPLTMLDPAMWQRWLHTHNLVLLLRHDNPLPQHLHLPNNSGRFQVVQCRHAATSLYALLKDWSTFVLIENHSYVRFMAGHARDSTSPWFFLVRATSKPPCVVIQLAFLGGTPAAIRYQMVDQLAEKIQQLAFPQRPTTNSTLSCCLILHKPVDKILIRYERMPSSLDTVVFPDGTQPALAALGSSTATAGALLTTLSRYLHHRRWVWAAQSGPHFPLGQDAVARILATLTKKRLREGFSFAHSTAGIINMVLEVEMMQDCCDNEHRPTQQYCVVQYVLFPPHIRSTSAKDSGSDDEGVDDGDLTDEGEMQLVTECWVEPQHGTVNNSTSERSYMDGLRYNRIADAICLVDAQCISSLLTMEHVHLMCEQGHVQPPPSCDVTQLLAEYPQEAAVWAEPRIRILPFVYNLTTLLPRCQQAELLFSMFIQDLTAAGAVGAANSTAGGGAQDPDAPNNLLLNILLDQLSMLHDRELPLSAEDSKQFVQHVRKRSRSSSATPLPLPTEYDNHSDRIPRWRCFVRGLSSTRVLLTLVPASYADLKTLMIPDPHEVRQQGVKLLNQDEGYEGECLDDMLSSAQYQMASPDARATPLPQQTPHTPLTPHTPYTPHTPAPSDNTYLLNHFSRRLRSSDADSSFGISPFDSPFRLRASSWDPKSGGSSLAVKRARTSSMGAKSKPSKLSIGSQGSPSPSPGPSLPTGTPTAESSPLSQWLGASASTSASGVAENGVREKEAAPWERDRDRVTCERSLSCEAALSTFRTRTQSMDSKSKRYFHSQSLVGQVYLRKDKEAAGLGTPCVVQRKRASSIDLKLRPPTRRRTISSQASYTLGSPASASTSAQPEPALTPQPQAQPQAHCHRNKLYGLCGGALGAAAVQGSVTLPVYVYDCPLTPLLDSLLQADVDPDSHPPDLFEDRTFKWDCPKDASSRSASTQAAAEPADDVSVPATPPPPTEDPDQEPPGAARDWPGLQQLSHALSVAYSKCFVLALFESLHTGLWVHAVDVQAAVDECEEALVEVDITRFLQTVCGHLKAEGPSAAGELLLATLAQSQSSTRCQELKLLHRLIKEKFRAILGTAFRPVASHPEFYYCMPAWDHKRLPEGHGGGMAIAATAGSVQPANPHALGLGLGLGLGYHSDCLGMGLSGRAEVPLPLPLQGLQGDGDVGQVVGVSGTGWDGVLCVTTPDDAHTSLLSNMDSNSLSEMVDEAQAADEVSPLFLHLVCSVHVHGDMKSYSIRGLPTCVNELARALDDIGGQLDVSLSTDNVTDKFQVTLDLLCLTLPRESETLSLSLSDGGCGPGPGLGVASRNSLQQQLSNNSGTSLEEAERLGADQLAHLPDYQQRAVTNLVNEMSWLMRDEMAACALDADEWPVREGTLLMVADHITQSHGTGRSTCLLETVPLQFVYETSKCQAKFVEALADLTVNGYRVQAVPPGAGQEGPPAGLSSLFYMVKDADARGAQPLHQLLPVPADADASTPVMPDSAQDIASAALQRAAGESAIEQSTDGSTVVPPSDSMSVVTERTAPTSLPGEGSTSTSASALGDVDRDSERHAAGLPAAAGLPGAGGLPPGFPAGLSAGMLGLGLGLGLAHHDTDICNWSEAAARHSEVSSLMESALGTEDGYDGGSSDSGQDCAWLLELEQKRDKLPNFWLILRVDGEVVTVLFHCRFLDMETEEVSSYRAVFAGVLEQLRRLCRRVNQTLLLLSLIETFTCDSLLEAEQGDDSWPHAHGEPALARLKSLDDSRDGDQSGTEAAASSARGAAAAKFEPGHFACGVVWETLFVLHPRLKTGPHGGKSMGMSRGIQALRSVLNRFSVSNRRNMFVYKDSQDNVFYLRLHESQRSMAKVSAPCGPLPHGFGPQFGAPFILGRDRERDTTGDNSPVSVSRSSSTASLNTSRRLHPSEDVASVSSISGDVRDVRDIRERDLRPRVRSFGEKEASSALLSSSAEGQARWSHYVREDYITLRVHGISDAGPDVKKDLVQVLQNRLDDAVLDVLSVMLSRNPMCKLSPEDVHFIQRQHQRPETSVQFSVPAHAELHVQALVYYLHQELLHFVTQPKYTDPQPGGHFQDYSRSPDSPSYIPEGSLYLYNQPTAAGSRGLACLAMGIMDRDGQLMLRSAGYRRPQLWAHAEAPLPEHFEELTSVRRHWQDANDSELDSTARVEFRIWKQGKVNLESLVSKLESAVKHAVWDLLTEFTILTAPIEEAGTPAPAPAPAPNPGLLSPTTTPSTTPNSQHSHLQSPTPRSQLHPVFHKSMQPWLQYAVDLGVASVRKHNISLAARHSLGVAVRELESLITAHAKDTRTAVFAEETDANGALSYRSWRWNDDESLLPTRCLLLTRNPSQWRCFVADPAGPPSKADAKVANKGLQKFLPLLPTSANDPRFVPRQRFLLTVVTSKDISVMTYNWSKDCVESLSYQTSLLGNWLSARSCLLTSIVCQKMGLFHNQPYLRTTDSNKNNQYLSHIGDLEMLAKFPRKETVASHPHPHAHQQGNPGTGRRSGGGGGGWSSGTSTPTSPAAVPPPTHGHHGPPPIALQHVFRDSKATPLPSPPSAGSGHGGGHGDLVVRHARQLLSTRQHDKHADQQRKLNMMSGWGLQSRGGGATPNIPLSHDVLQLFLQHARTIHYCLTPLLFLPRWRVDAAATRDHSLSVSPPGAPGSKPPPPGALPGSAPTSRSTPRSTPRGTPAKERRGSSASVAAHAHGGSPTDRWHQALCAHFVHEYQQYLQTLGFIPVQTQQQDAPQTSTSPLRRRHYLQKSLLGGVLMVELLLAEPFFHSRLHALECSRMQTKSPTFISQFTVSFLDECDKVKVLLHLHSFTYDYHLRCLHGCVTGKHSLLPAGYHLALFLDDFLKYYSKAPNFARNLVHADSVTVRDIATPGQQLFDYLLTNDKAYGMDVFRMAPVTYDDGEGDAHVQNEFVLVQHKTTPHLSYRDVHDLKQTDDFEVTLIVCHDPTWTPGGDDAQLCLKYFIVLTSRRELYPKAEVERKQGKFRTVSTANLPPVTTPPPPPPHQHSAPLLMMQPLPLPQVAQTPPPQDAVQITPLIVVPVAESLPSGMGVGSATAIHALPPASSSSAPTSVLAQSLPLPSSLAVSTSPGLLEVVPHDDPARGVLPTDRLPSPASEATPGLCSVLGALDSPTALTVSAAMDVPASLPLSMPSAATSIGTAHASLGGTECGSLTSDSGGQLSTSHHVEIRQEAVNYLGYYSSHEQLMQQLILQQAASARSHIETMVTQGAVHCRTHMLWTRLMCPATGSSVRSIPRDHQQGQSLSYSEFQELVHLALLKPLSSLDSRLAPLLAQPLSWYQGLARVLLTKYADHNRQFPAPDGTVQHIVVLHPRYLDAFVMLTLDLHTARGELAVVYRKRPKTLHHERERGASGADCSINAEEIFLLVEGLVNACCFHLWAGLVQ